MHAWPVEASRQRLGDKVRARRKQFRPRLTQAAAAARAGISDTTWLKVENGQVVSDDTYVVVEQVIRWQAGSAQIVLEGGEPIELPLDDESEEDLRALIADLRRRLAAVEAQLAKEPPEGGNNRTDRPA